MAILDDFNRPDESPATGWSTVNLFSPVFNIVDNEAVGGFATYDGVPIVTNVAVTATLTTAVTTAVRVLARMTDTSSNNGTGYGFGFSNEEGPQPNMIRYDSGQFGSIGNWIDFPLFPTLGPGDKISLRCVGGRIEGWYYYGGNWVLIQHANDGTYGSGLVGLQIPENETLDDFDVEVLPLKAVPSLQSRSARRRI